MIATLMIVQALNISAVFNAAAGSLNRAITDGHAVNGRWSPAGLGTPANNWVGVRMRPGESVAVSAPASDNFRARANTDREAIIAQIRAMAKPLPAGWKFDREEANRRGPDFE